MANLCNGLIKRGLPSVDCANLPAKGYERVAVLINREDIDFAAAVLSETKKNVITELGLKAEAKGFKVYQMGGSPFTGTNNALEDGTYFKGVTKTLVIASLSNDRDVQGEFVDPMINGEFVAVLERKDKGPDKNSAFEVLGFHNGLKLTALAEDPYGDNYSGGLYTLTETGAPATRMYLGETYEAGKALFDSLAE